MVSENIKASTPQMHRKISYGQPHFGQEQLPQFESGSDPQASILIRRLFQTNIIRTQTG